MKAIPDEKLMYLLDYLDSCIESAVYDVLADSDTDPEHSAVTTANLIKCYIDVKKAMGQQTCYNSVNEYLRFHCFTSTEAQEFEQKRLRETTYYIGKQY